MKAFELAIIAWWAAKFFLALAIIIGIASLFMGGKRRARKSRN